jgi:gas vesicle protein
VNERSAIVFGAVIGAALGGFAGYLFLTESGTRLRRRLEPQLSDVLHEFQALQGAVARARDAATRGWRAAADDEAGEWREAGQTAPY